MSRALSQWVAASLAALVLLSGCGGPTTAGDGSTTTVPPGTTSATVTSGEVPGEVPGESFGTPPTEDTGGVEEPEAPPAESVSLDLAGLPVGGFAEPLSGTDRCVHVNWSGPPDIPAGVEVRATGVGLRPADSFVVVPDACPGATPCLGTGHLMDAALQCVVGVRQVAPTSDGSGALSLTAGTVTCPAGGSAACEQFVADVSALGPDEITWSDAEVSPTEEPSEPTDPATEEPAPTGGEPTDGDSSSQTG